jgi:TonB-linked SusC/RagA family outer membrane protein
MLQVHASSFAQKVTLNKSNTDLSVILNDIRKQTGFSVLYDATMIVNAKPVTIRLTDAALEDALRQCFQNQPFGYAIKGNTIIIVPKPHQEIITQAPITVTGTVNDEKGRPIPGASVRLKGSNIGTVTDGNGHYSIKIPEGKGVLVFSFIGSATREINVADNSQLDVILKEQPSSLNEVVVIGYGTQKKSDLTGAISTISAKDLEKSTPLNATESLQGRATGVNVTSSDGSPGAGSTIRIRGIGTVNNNTPLFVIDGTFANSIDNINPSDIANIEVLKDASASAIYGSRGANGVILVTTKKGSNGPPVVSFDASGSLSQISKFPKTLNRDEFLNYQKTAYYNGYLQSVVNADPTVNPLNTTLPYFSYLTKVVVPEYNKGYNTDWQSVIFKKAAVQNYNVAIRGATPDVRYFISAGYLNQTGIISNSSYRRYNFRLNTEYTLAKPLVFGENLGVTYGQLRGFSGAAGSGSAAASGPTGIALIVQQADPLSPVINPNANPSDPNYVYNKYYHSLVSNSSNPASQVALENNNTGALEALGNVYGELSVIKGLKVRSSLGYDYLNSSNTTFNPQYSLAGVEQNLVSQISESRVSSMSLIWENTANYTTTIASKHNITGLIGYTRELYVGNTLTGSAQGTPNNDPSLQVINSATSQYVTTGNKTNWAQQSYLARLLYSYSDRYLFTASVRRDGSSKFGPGHQYGVFPSFSVGWRVNNEEFFKKLNWSFIDNFKIRGGYGQLGNQSTLNTNPNLSLVSSATTFRYIFGNNVANGNYYSTLGTPTIGWETSVQSNIGVDLDLFHNAINISADYFIKDTKNMLLQVAMPAYAGYPGSPYTNAGEVQNKGFETSIGYNGQSGAFKWGVSGNISLYTNRVLNLGPGNKPITTTGIYAGATSRTVVGQSIGQFYGYVTQGIFQTQAEINNYTTPGGALIQPNAHPGDFRFKSDANGVIQQYFIGNPLPKFTYGFTLNTSCKNFDLVAFFQGVYGNQIFDASKAYNSKATALHTILESAYYAAWNGAGTSESQPIISTVDNNNNYRASTWYIQSGSYLRLKNLQIGYTFDKDFVKKAGLSKARLFIGATDLFTITKYKGNDPETDISNPLLSGVDYSTYPKIKRYSVGINATF